MIFYEDQVDASANNQDNAGGGGGVKFKKANTLVAGSHLKDSNI